MTPSPILAVDYLSKPERVKDSSRRVALRAGGYAAVAGLLLAVVIGLRLVELLPHPPVLSNRNELLLLALAACFGTVAICLSGRAYQQAVALASFHTGVRQLALGSLILSISVTVGIVLYFFCSQQWLINWGRSVFERKLLL